MRKNIYLISLIIMMTEGSFGQMSGVDQLVIMTNKQTSTQETANGIKPVLAQPSAGWTHFLRQDMNEIWKSIHLKGVNYYCVGEPAAGNSYTERSDFKSSFYQAWFGTYVVDARKQLFDFPNDDINSDKKQVIDQLLKIGMLDQSSWLYAMGDKAAMQSTTLTDSAHNYAVLDHLSIDGQTVPVIAFSYNSHSDLGDSTTQLSSLMGRPAGSYWQPALDSHHPVVLTGFYIFWFNKMDQTLKIIYGNGCSFETKDKSVFHTYSSIKDGMLAMAKQLKYVTVSK